MTATDSASTTDTWAAQLEQLRVRYRHVRPPVLAALNILVNDQNIVDSVDGFLRAKQFLVVDRDTKFDRQFRDTLASAGVAVLTTAREAPNMSSFAERFVLTAKNECLNKMIFFGEAMLRRALREFVGVHYHEERPHQGRGNEVLRPAARIPSQTGSAPFPDRTALRN